MKYRDMTYLIGEELVIHENLDPHGNRNMDFYYSPDRVECLAEYPKTILIRKHYRHGSYCRMIPKAAMYCGDVRLSWRGHMLTGKEVATHEESI